MEGKVTDVWLIAFSQWCLAFDWWHLLTLSFCYRVSEQNAGGPGGSETSGRRQRRQEIRGRRDGGNQHNHYDVSRFSVGFMADS